MNFTAKQMIVQILDQLDYENNSMGKVLDFLYSMQLIEFKQALDDTEQTVILQNHKLQLLNGALKGEVLNIELPVPKPKVEVVVAPKQVKPEVKPAQQ